MLRWTFFLSLALFTAADDVAEPLSVEQLAAGSELVLHGEVVAKTVQRDSSARIHTEVEVALRDVWKGAWDQKTIPILHSGGILGEKGVKIIGQARYEIGEEVVLFLTRTGTGSFTTVGMSWGKFTVLGHDKTAVQQGVENAPPLPLPLLKNRVQQASIHE